jgi:hypothetical protein
MASDTTATIWIDLSARRRIALGWFMPSPTMLNLDRRPEVDVGHMIGRLTDVVH